MVDNLAPIVEQKATPEAVLAEMAPRSAAPAALTRTVIRAGGSADHGPGFSFAA